MPILESLPTPLPNRLIVRGHMDAPEGYIYVAPESRPIRNAPPVFVSGVSRHFSGRCTCAAKAWFNMFFTKSVLPDTPIIVCDEPSDFLDWVISVNPNWYVYTPRDAL